MSRNDFLGPALEAPTTDEEIQLHHILKLALLAGLVASFLMGCGGSEPPTAVAPSDLHEASQFWNELTPVLKRELIDFGKEKLGVERPEGAKYITATSDSAILLEMDREFSEAAHDESAIYAVYVEANDQVAKEQVNELMPYLEEGR